MSGQLVELIIFAGVAFFIINKLISILGSTSEDDATRGKSLFGERSQLKDVTPTSETTEATGFKGYNILKSSFTPFSKKPQLDLDGLVAKENEAAVRSGLLEIMEKMPSFDVHKFAKGAKIAFQMILDFTAQNNYSELAELVDKRYLEQFNSISSSYGKYLPNTDLKIQISEAYTFGNSIFIKILFYGTNVTEKINNFTEEWTFSKSMINAGPQWYLTNIDRLR